MRWLFSAALDTFLTFAGPLTVVISETIDSPSDPETGNASLEAGNLAAKSYPTVAEQLAKQILGELNSAVGALKDVCSGKPTSCVIHHPTRCNML